MTIAMWPDKLFNRGMRAKRKACSLVFLIVFLRIIFCFDYLSIIRVMIFMVLFVRLYVISDQHLRKKKTTKVCFYAMRQVCLSEFLPF